MRALVLVLAAGCAARPLPLPERDLGVAAPELDLAVAAAADLSARDLTVVVVDLAGRDLASSCPSYDEWTCRAHKECVTDYCVPCSCKPAFAGCRAASAPAASCPTPQCPFTCCQAMPQCTDFMKPLCVPYGQSPGCGICLDVWPCQTDDDCLLHLDGGWPPGGPGGYPVPPGPVCDYPGDYGMCGSCMGGKGCINGCASDAGCREGQVCTAAHHCVARPCAGDADCPLQFSCVSGSCARTTCSVDGDCPHGFCVGGECFEGYGTCMPYPA
jgi:hypothetical protein